MSAIAEARVNAGWQHMKRRTSVSSSSGAVSIAVHSVAVSASKANSLSRRRRAISVNTPDERYAVLLPFIQEGLELGEKAIHTVDPRRRQEHLGRNSSFAQFRVHTAWTAAYATRRISSGGSALRWTTVSETVVAVSRALRDVKLLRQAAVLRTRAFLRLVRSKANEKPLQPASPLP